jgi:hypothetical protein
VEYGWDGELDRYNDVKEDCLWTNIGSVYWYL